MGRARQQALDARRLQLQRRSHDLRARLGEESGALQRPLAVADAVRGRLRWMAAHPQWIAAVALLPVIVRPRRALGWALKLWWGWRAWQQLRPMLAAIRPGGRPPAAGSGSSIPPFTADRTPPPRTSSC